MKIALISILTPYKENYNGTSALPYHLMAHREDNISITIYSFNNNHLSSDRIKEVERNLNVEIHLIPLPKWFIWMFKFHLLFIRLFLSYPVHNYIKLPKHVAHDIQSENFDGIWVYGEEMSRVVRQFPGMKRVHTLPDSESLYYYRMLRQRFVIKNFRKFWRCAFMYPKFLNMERNFENNSSVKYHLVGEKDAKFLQNLNPGIQAMFIRHPHYEVLSRGNMKFHTPIKLLIAGQCNLYMKQDVDLFVDALLRRAELKLYDQYELCFLGKGWDSMAKILSDSNWKVEYIPFAENYIEAISKFDIQISPITIGTGTKGKVLDALANGLLVIGSQYAMENIAVEHGKSCIVYRQPEDIISILNDIYHDPQIYEKMATVGRDAVLMKHGRKAIAEQLFSQF